MINLVYQAKLNGYKVYISIAMHENYSLFSVLDDIERLVANSEVHDNTYVILGGVYFFPWGEVILCGFFPKESKLYSNITGYLYEKYIF